MFHRLFFLPRSFHVSVCLLMCCVGFLGYGTLTPNLIFNWFLVCSFPLHLFWPSHYFNSYTNVEIFFEGEYGSSESRPMSIGAIEDIDPARLRMSVPAEGEASGVSLPFRLRNRLCVFLVVPFKWVILTICCTAALLQLLSFPLLHIDCTLSTPVVLPRLSPTPQRCLPI